MRAEGTCWALRSIPSAASFSSSATAAAQAPMRHPGVSIYRRFSIKEPYEESYFFLERAFDLGLALAFAGTFFFAAAFFFNFVKLSRFFTPSIARL